MRQAAYTEFVPGTPPADSASRYPPGHRRQRRLTTTRSTTRGGHRTTSGGHDRSTVTPYIDGVAQTAVNIADVDLPVAGWPPDDDRVPTPAAVPVSAPSPDFAFGCDIGDVVIYNQALIGRRAHQLPGGRYGNLTASADLETGDGSDQSLTMRRYGLSCRFRPRREAKRICCGQDEGPSGPSRPARASGRSRRAGVGPRR